MRSFLPFAALLGVALVLACQDVGTGPDGLLPQFNKKGAIEQENCPVQMRQGHCHVAEDPVPTPAAAFVKISHTIGDIATIPEDIFTGSGRKDTGVGIGAAFSTVQIVLSEAFVHSQPGWEDGDRGVCFEDEEGNRTWGGVGLGAREGKGAGEAIGGYNFTALGIDGETLLRYAIEVTGTFTTSEPDAAFVPGVDKTTTVIWTEGLMWVSNDADGLGCVGGGGKLSAQKSVVVGGTVTITGVPALPQ